jgi:glycosyltransferase involved in cell wall biosynthesis
LKKIVFIAPFSWIGISNPLINTAIYLADKGYQIDIYTVFNKTNTERGINNFDFNNEKINVFTLRENLFQKVKSKLTDKSYFYFLSQIDVHKYNLLIAFNLDGLRIVAQLSEKTGIKYIFFSLEIEEPDQLLPMDLDIAQNAVLTITQHESRKVLLSELYDIEMDDIYIIPNAPMGKTLMGKKNYFFQNYSIPDTKKIVLITGTLGADHCVDKIIGTVPTWGDDFVCVLHGWFVGELTEKLFKNMKNKYPERIYHSDKILPFHEKNTIFQSIDIGFVSFDPRNDNLRYAIGSAGKLYDFLRCGKPIIVSALPFAKEMIEEKGCGYIINEYSLLPEIFEKVEENYESLVKNCFSIFDQYEFSTNFENIYNLLRKY